MPDDCFSLHLSFHPMQMFEDPRRFLLQEFFDKPLEPWARHHDDQSFIGIHHHPQMSRPPALAKSICNSLSVKDNLPFHRYSIYRNRNWNLPINYFVVQLEY